MGGEAEEARVGTRETEKRKKLMTVPSRARLGLPLYYLPGLAQKLAHTRNSINLSHMH